MPPALIANSRCDCGRQCVQTRQQFVQALPGKRRVGGYGFVEVVYVGLMVLIVMDLHSLRVDIRLERVVRVGQWRQRKWRSRRHNGPGNRAENGQLNQISASHGDSFPLKASAYVPCGNRMRRPEFRMLAEEGKCGRAALEVGSGGNRVRTQTLVRPCNFNPAACCVFGTKSGDFPQYRAALRQHYWGILRASAVRSETGAGFRCPLTCRHRAMVLSAAPATGRKICCGTRPESRNHRPETDEYEQQEGRETPQAIIVAHFELGAWFIAGRAGRTKSTSGYSLTSLSASQTGG